MSIKCFSLLVVFLAIFSINVYSLENQQTEKKKEKPEKFQPFVAYASDERKFVWFRVFKVASQTLTQIFQVQIPDLISFRSKTLPKQYQTYFKFAFVRNPWDRIVSCYFNKIVKRDLAQFEECYDKDFDYFVNYINKLDVAMANPHIRLQTRLIPIKLCDFIGKIDNFENDLKYVCNIIGIEVGNLPHTNKTEHKHYSTYYNSITMQIIAEKYKEDIEIFGFTFETK